MRLLKIGRDVSCDIVIQANSVSSLHAEMVMLDSGDMTIEDKNSTNGTYVSNQRIKPGSPVNIRRGDKIVFGDVELNWSQVPQPEDNSAYKGIYGVGSHFSNYIQVSGTTVSRYHATIKHGKDGKFYIVDHSKNGTTLDGVKLQKNIPYTIKKKSAVVCGGSVVDLSRLPWPSNVGKTIITIAAGLVILLGLSYALFIPDWPKKRSDQYLYNQYESSVVMVRGIYHYDVQIGDWTKEEMDEYNGMFGEEFKERRIPLACVWLGGQYQFLYGEWSSKGLSEIILEYAEKPEYDNTYFGTGFFVSNDGLLATNLHVVKPWIFSNDNQGIEQALNQLYNENYEILKNLDYRYAAKLVNNIGKVKLVGVLDYLAICPANEIFDTENHIKCRVACAGEDANVDVALIQTMSRTLPNRCSCVNINDSLDIDKEALKVGNHIYTIGFPGGRWFQEENGSLKEPIRLFAQGGSISQGETEYLFGFNAVSTGGASGSPIFNEYGMLVGVLNSGRGVQGYNYGVKAKYLKELIDTYEQKNK